MGNTIWPDGPTGGVLHDIYRERIRQDILKAEGRFKFTCADPIPNTERLTILMEEIGEAARALLEMHRLVNDVHGSNLRKELVQCAAVIVAWIEGIERDGKTWEYFGGGQEIEK